MKQKLDDKELELENERLEFMVQVKDKHIKYIEERYKELVEYCDTLYEKLIKLDK